MRQQKDTDRVLLQIEGGVATITLNRPEKLNALTRDMYMRINELLQDLDANPDVRVVRLKGNGRAFSSGYDLSEQVKDGNIGERRDFLNRVANDNRWRIWRLSKPVVTQLHGYCLAGAFELVMPSDFIIASEDCVLGEPEVSFGAGPAFFMVPWLTNLRHAKQLLMTGANISGAQAAEWGIVTEAVPLADLEDHVNKLVARLVALPQDAVRLIKEGINRVYEHAGIVTHIDTWVDTAMVLRLIGSAEAREFRERVEDQGVSAAVAWRDGRLGG